MFKKGWPLLGLGLILAGCSPQQQQQTNQNLQQAGQKIEHGAQNLAHNIGKAMSNEDVTFQVKKALGASAKLNGSHIDVSTQDGTSPNTKIVTLSGTVANASQKALADRIVSDTVGSNVKIVDAIQVGTPKS
ncbi:MAG TPA: BON domain-containing protein [Chthonomonadaceae bacterium]|nr:BON domain-containing protein [Chthonomonadaceae bacterium]